MSTAHPAFAPLAKFSAKAFGAADDVYSFSEVSEDWQLEDLFGDEPEHVFVFHGDLQLTKLSVNVSGDDAGVYVIEGDLTVDGPLEITQTDGASVLYVTGDVSAKSIKLADQAHLWVGGELNVEGDTDLSDLEDAGALVVGGETWSDDDGADEEDSDN